MNASKAGNSCENLQINYTLEKLFFFLLSRTYSLGHKRERTTGNTANALSEYVLRHRNTNSQKMFPSTVGKQDILQTI